MYYGFLSDLKRVTAAMEAEASNLDGELHAIMDGAATLNRRLIQKLTSAELDSDK